MKLIKRLASLAIIGTIVSAFAIPSYAADLDQSTGAYTFKAVVSPRENVKVGDKITVSIYVTESGEEKSDIYLQKSKNSMFKATIKYSSELLSAAFYDLNTWDGETDFVGFHSAATPEAIVSDETWVNTTIMNILNPQMVIPAEDAALTYTFTVLEKANTQPSWTIGFVEDECVLQDGLNSTQTQKPLFDTTEATFKMASSIETEDFENVDEENQTVKDETTQEAKTYDGKYLKHISTILEDSALSKYVSITCGNETRISTRTVAEILGGISVNNTSVSGKLAIGVLTDNPDAVFTFDLIAPVAE